MIPLVSDVVRIAGGQCAPDEMGGGWVQSIGAAHVPHLTHRASPNNRFQATAISIRPCLPPAIGRA